MSTSWSSPGAGSSPPGGWVFSPQGALDSFFTSDACCHSAGMATVWKQDQLRTEQIGGLTWIPGRAPAHLTLWSQPFPDYEAGVQTSRCSSLSRNPALARKCLAGEGSSSESSRQKQDLLWRQYFLDPTLWRDNRQHKKSSSSPDFRRKGSSEGLWLNNFHKPDWVDEQLAALDMQMGRCVPTSKSSLPDMRDPGRPAGSEMGVTAVTVSTMCQQGKLIEAVEAVEILAQTDCPISKSLFYTVLKHCVAKKDLILGRRVHALTVKLGYESDTFLCNHILRMYASHARLDEAMDVFTLVAKPDAFTWSAIISANVKHAQAKQAIQLYRQMRCSSVKPDGHVFVAALQACAREADLETGQQVHADVLASGVEPDLFVVSCLVDMYAKCGSLKDAQRLFDGLGEKDVVTWTVLIAGYSQQGMGQEALHLYSAMQKEGIAAPDSVTFVCLLQACASVGSPALEKGKQLHARIEKRGLQADLVVGSSLVNMYAKCGSLETAQRLFDGLGQKNVVTWNAMIAGYVQQGMGLEALHLYGAMQEESIATADSVTFVCLLQACATVGTTFLEKGKQLHAQIEKRGLQADVVVGGSLVNMYAKCGSLEAAQSVFDMLPQKNVVTWNAMVAGYAQKGMVQEALYLYSAMQEEGIAAPDSVTFACLLQACARMGTLALEKGKQLHAQIEEQGLQADVVLGGSLVNMYAKCGSLNDAQRVFDRIPHKNVVAWNTLVAGYAQQGMGQEALHLYSVMQEEGIAAPDSVTFVCLLQACASVGIPALEQGKQLHAEIEGQGLQGDVVLGGSLVNMYAKCGSLEDAQRVFDRIPQKTVVTWNAMVAGYVQWGMGQEALRLYKTMQQERIAAPDSVTFVSLLQACASVGTPALEKGKQLHAQIEEQGLQADGIVGCSLVNMYAKCGSLEDAQRLFDRLGQKTVVTWTSMIAGYAQQGMGQEALNLYSAMQEEGISVPDSVAFVCLLQACASVAALHPGRQLHAQIEEQGLLADVVVANSLINMYAKCGILEAAQGLFDELCHKDVVTWNAMIAGYSQHGMGQEALHLYSAMQEEGIAAPDSVTFVCLLQACASVGTPALEKGKQLHAQIGERGFQADMVLGCSLVNMYAQCGSLEDAQSLFDGFGQKNVVTWNAMIAGYVQQGMGQEALHLYSAMEEEGIATPDFVTFVCLLQACASVGTTALEKGKQLHAQIEERGLQADVVVGGSLVNMYAKCGSLEDAQSVFDTLPQKNVVTWNAMVAGYAQQGMGQGALHLYSAMQEEGISAPDTVTFVCLLQACASLGRPAMEEGKRLHAQVEARGLQANVVVGSSLVNMYAKCGSLEDAQSVFDMLPEKHVVTWNAMIAGYSQQGMSQEALQLYSAMQEEGVAAPDSVTFVCLLQACANVAALHPGKQFHAEIEEQGLQADVFIASSLINMYAKCGSMVDAQQVFDALPERDIVAWNALIAGYTRQGDVELVFDLVHRMGEDCIQQDSITVLSLITVCSHAGLVDKGRGYFEAMSAEYSITPTMEHYTCMVDLLGRAGQLDEALELIRRMPVKPDAVVWHTLLGACRKWSNVEVGQHAFDEAVQLDEKDAAAYVMMCNIYTGAQMWEEAQTMQERRKEMGAWKQPGQSWWTDMSGIVHAFLVGDKQHPESDGIYARLKLLVPKMKKEGYVPHLDSSLRGTSDVEKEAHLWAHSEKLAIAYALNKTPEGTIIRIVKNLRVCEDCHTATAYISKIEKRTIVCRDASRFHVYKDGKCSCGDYW